MRLTQILCFAAILPMNWDFNAICIFLNKQIEKTGTILLPSSNGELLLDAPVLHFLPFEINCFNLEQEPLCPGSCPFLQHPLGVSATAVITIRRAEEGKYLITGMCSLLHFSFCCQLPLIGPFSFLAPILEVTLPGVSLSRFHICSTVQ